MSNEQFVQIHNAIKTLQERIALRLFPEYGICSALDDIIELEMRLDSCDAFDSIRQWMEDWSEHSGNSSYPVPAPGLSCPIKAFYEHHDQKEMWVGVYGDSRLRLLAYLEKRAHFAAYVN